MKWIGTNRDFDFIGQEVYSKAYGDGIVVDFDGHYFKIDFKGLEKIFVLDSVIKGFITFKDPKYQNQINMYKDREEEKMEEMKEPVRKAYSYDLIYSLIKPNNRAAVDEIYETINKEDVMTMLPNWHLGTNAYNIYCACCLKFGWNINRAYEFGNYSCLYSNGATQEGYSPWFIRHITNVTNSQGGTWSNKISSDYKHIEETWYEPDERYSDDNSLRVVFIMYKSEYNFLGVFKVVDKGRIYDEEKKKYVYVKKYDMISKTYPF